MNEANAINIFVKKIFLGVKLQKNSKKLKFYENSSSPLGVNEWKVFFQYQAVIPQFWSYNAEKVAKILPWGHISKKNHGKIDFWPPAVNSCLQKSSSKQVDLLKCKWKLMKFAIKIWKNLGGGGGRKCVKFRFEVLLSKKMGFFAIFSFGPP